MSKRNDERRVGTTLGVVQDLVSQVERLPKDAARDMLRVMASKIPARKRRGNKGRTLLMEGLTQGIASYVHFVDWEGDGDNLDEIQTIADETLSEREERHRSNRVRWGG